MQLPEYKPASGNPAKQLVLLLHGWGADGANLIDLADMLSQDLPHAHFIAPNAPDVCEVNPYGYQWFSLMDRTPSVMLSGARRAAEHLDTFIDAQLESLSLPPSALALVGFSQGTMLALHTGLRRTPAPAAVAGFSGALIGAEVLSGEIKSRPPVCLIHGRMDDVVPYAAMAYAEESLKQNAVPVQTHTRPHIGHSIDMEGIAIAGKFLKQAFA